MPGYIILVRDDTNHDGSRLNRCPVYFVGRRDSLAAVLDDVELYRRDPLAAGHFFAVHVNARDVVTPGETFNAIDCLDYQSCEHPGWRTSEAYAFLSSLRDSLCRKVEGYASSPWGWDTDDLEGRTLEFSRRII